MAPGGRNVDSMSSSTRARSLADDLRQRDRDALIALLSARPDLLSPLPESVSELARSAATAPSIRMALHQLDARSLAVAQALSVEPVTVDPEVLGERLPAGSDAKAVVRHGLDRLHELALLWRDGERDHVLREVPATVRNVCGDHVTVFNAEAVAPQPERVHDPDRVDRLAGDRGVLAVAELRDILDRLPRLSIGITRDGVVGLRDLTAAAEALGLAQSRLAMWLELGWLAGLLGPAGETVGVTEAGSQWCVSDIDVAWPLLVQAWWWSDRDWSQFDQEIEPRPHVFGNDHVSSAVATVRRQWLGIVAEAQSGAQVGNIAEVIIDRHPLAWGGLMRSRLDALVTSVAAEAETLGVAALGALSAMGRQLPLDATVVDPRAPEAAGELVALAGTMLPTLTDRILVQGDHTIIAPGPLFPDLAEALGRFADVESVGGATVYRITADSLGRALLAGLLADEILGTLQNHSDVPVPQSVTYLINDIAARHGRVRVGRASAYLSADDPAALAAVIAALGSSTQVHRVNATVLVTEGDPAALLAAARAAGYPALAADGTTSGGTQPAPPPQPPAVVAAGVPAARIAAAADVLLAGGAPLPGVLERDVPDVQRMHSAQVQAVLARASARGQRVWVRYADNAGSTSTRLVTVVTLGGGALEGVDLGRGQLHKFALSRIAGVIVDSETGGDS